MSETNAWPGTSILERLCAELISLRERNDRQHKLYDQALSALRDEVTSRLAQFTADEQHAFQQLRDGLTGEKRHSLALATTLVDLALDWERVASAVPPLDGVAPAVARWADGISIAARKAQAALAQLGIHRYDAVVGDLYQPALHERVGAERSESVSPGRVLRQIEPGYASAAPDFVVRRARVVLAE